MKKEKHILMVVDDEKSTQKMLQDLLTNEGYTIELASNGEECINKIKKGIVPDVIILDIMMPIMSGWDVAAKIKGSNELNYIPIIFLTAKSDSTSRQLGSFTSHYYIEKPFEIGDLLQKIKDVLIRNAKK